MLFRPGRMVGLAAQITGATLVGLLFTWLAVRGLDWVQVGQLIRGASASWLLLGLGCMLLAGVLRAIRWRLLFPTRHTSAFRLFFVEHIGIGLNNVSPLRVVSEPVQFGLLTLRDHLSAGTVLATMAVRSVLDLSVTILVLGIGLVVIPAIGSFTPYAIVAAILSALGIAALFIIGAFARRLPWLARMGLTRPFNAALRLIRRRRLAMVVAVVLTLAYWTVIGMTGWMVAQGMGIALSIPVVIILTLACLFFGTSVPGLPAAFGPFEFAVVLLFGLLGLAREEAFAYGVVLHAVLFLSPTLVAALALPREGLSSLKVIREVLERWRHRTSLQSGPLFADD